MPERRREDAGKEGRRRAVRGAAVPQEAGDAPGGDRLTGPAARDRAEPAWSRSGASAARATTATLRATSTTGSAAA
jgi:hypothetical protein